MRRPVRFSPPVRRFTIAVSVALVLLAVDAVSWWLLSSRLITEAAAWQQARIAAGYIVATGPPRRAGWPLRAEIVLPEVSIATGAPATPTALAWQTGEARLIFTPWHPTEITVELGGAQTLQFGAAPAITLQLDNLDLVVPLDQAGQADGVLVTTRHVQLPLPTGALSIDALWLKLAAMDVHLSLSAVTLPVHGLPLGATVGSLDLQARSTVPLPEQRDPAAAAAAWRDAGGQLVVSDLALGWGPLDVHGVGSFSLDRALQPAGSGTLRLTGYAQALDALVIAGTITANNAKVANTLLSLVSHVGRDGVPQAEVPFTLRDGLLSAGAIPLARLPPLALP